MVIPSNQSSCETRNNKKDNKIVNNNRGKKRFYWDCVLNNYTEKDCEAVKTLFEEIGDAYIVGKEIGDLCKTKHLQMMIKLKKGNYKSFILGKCKDTVLGNRVSIREGRNIDAMKNYCLKDGNILFQHNIANITSKKHDKKQHFELNVRHMMTHNDKLNDFQLKYIKENYNDVDKIYQEQYDCSFCKNERV